MKPIKPDEFFKQIAIHSGLSDLRTIKDVYYGMVRTISRELKDKHVVELPDWGEFNLKIHKSRRFISVNGQAGILPPKPTVKFSPNNNVKKYFYALGDDSTVVK